MDYLHKKNVNELFTVLLELKTTAEARKFLRDLLTEAEIKEFANRWQVVRMLDKKVPYETITKQTGMSSTTIARIAKWLNGKIGGYKFMLERTKNNKEEHHAPLLAE